MGILDVCDAVKVESQTLDYIGKQNIWISNTYTPAVNQLARQLIGEALFSTAPGQLSVLGYDGDLSGVFAPFASLSTGESRVLELISDEQDLATHLQYIQQHIQAIQNVIQGRTDSLIQFRKDLNRPIEGYRLVVIATDIGLIEQDMLAKLSLLMRSGPACGISFLIISTTYISRQTAEGKEIELKVSSIAPNITILEPDNISVTSLSAIDIINRCASFSQSIRTAQLPVVTFEEIHQIPRLWQEKSVDGVTFSVGKYGINDMEVTIGDEINQRHNAIITGAVGQGKSNLISVIIHSLCMRYSPRELQLYLLDFKEGVTFKAFSNIGQDEYLPHAKALGLESDVSFGLAVLESLYKTYQQRMRILKEHSVKSIREFRKRYPEVEMPRIVVIIDEFQMMFGDDLQEGQTIADTLEKSVRLFRAAGIHFILASQTLIGNMALANKRDSLFAQVPIRIALKNSLSESQQVLNLNNSAAAFLRPREAIVNLDYGEVSQNRKTIIAYADDAVLKPIRKMMWEKGRSFSPPPYVFESEKRITVSSCAEYIRARRTVSAIPAAVLGDKISIDREHIAIPLPNEPGRNIAILGTPDGDCNLAVGMMQGMAVSLALQHPKGDARFLFCDFTGNTDYAKQYPQFAKLMEDAGYFLESLSRMEFEPSVRELLDHPAGQETVYLFAAGLDRWEYTRDGFNQESVLKAFAETAPSKGMHLIGWWVKPSSFTAQVAGFGSSDAFNTKVFLRLDERAVQSLTSPFVRWTAQNNRALASDSVEFEKEITFIPFAPVTQNDVSIFRAEV